ncbi:MAG: Spy/CpxP family protein refolding chaperone [Parvibaculum sp.]|nr:Spy/CpxP family protein refolding chaperone [Parvibaculum sp.]
MNKLFLTGAVILSTALGVSTFALADKAPHGDRSERHAVSCSDRNAREIGKLAELEAKLKPTAAQTAAWTAYEDTLTAQAAAAEKSCLDRVAARKAAGDDKKRPTIIERQAMMEQGLETKLSNLKATKPVLTKLYASLSVEQKQVMDKEGMRHGRKGHGDWKHKAGYKHHGDKPAAPEAPVEQ